METYLRLIQFENKNRSDELELFEGNIKEDKEYWEKHQKGKARYFELKEFIS